MSRLLSSPLTVYCNHLGCLEYAESGLHPGDSGMLGPEWGLCQLPGLGGAVGVVRGGQGVVVVMDLMSEEAEKHHFFGAKPQTDETNI